MSFLEVEKLHKVYPDGTQAVRDFGLNVEAGQFVVLLGPSGCGKTTTLRMLAGLEMPTSGAIRLAGEDVTRRRPRDRDVGFVFQFYALYPQLNVYENLAFPLRAAKVPDAELRRRVDEVAQRLGIVALLARRPSQLSGGDRQRVSLGRCLVRAPRLYLMDEPLGTLDPDQRLAMREFIREQQQQLGVTSVYVTHDQEEAMSLADRVVVMNQGSIVQEGTPLAVYDRPAERFVAEFVGSPSMNFMAGEVAEDATFMADFQRIPLPHKFPLGKAVLGVRPEHVHLDHDGPVSATVVTVEYLGSTRFVHFETLGGNLVMRAASRGVFRPGETYGLTLDPDHLHLFGPNDGGRWG